MNSDDLKKAVRELGVALREKIGTLVSEEAEKLKAELPRMKAEIIAELKGDGSGNKLFDRWFLADPRKGSTPEPMTGPELQAAIDVTRASIKVSAIKDEERERKHLDALLQAQRFRCAQYVNVAIDSAKPEAAKP